MPDQTPHPSLRALLQHIRGDTEALRLLAILLVHVAPELLHHLPPEPHK